MPSSERQHEHRARTYLVVMGLVCLFCGGALCSLNLVMDVAGTFGLAGRFAINRLQPQGVIDLNSYNLPIDVYVRTMARSDAALTLVGTSRVRSGFDLCQEPGLAKIAFNGGNAWDLAAAQKALLAGAAKPLTVILEVTGLGRGNHIRRPTMGALEFYSEALFSYRTTKISFVKLFYNLAVMVGAPEKTICVPEMPHARTEHEKYDVLQQWKAIALITLSRRDELKNIYRQALIDAEALCREQGLRHRIWWGAFPYSRQVMQDPLLRSVIGQWTQFVAEALAEPRPDKGACEIRLINFNQGSWPGLSGPVLDETHWYDSFHFEKDIGTLVLQQIRGRLVATSTEH